MRKTAFSVLIFLMLPVALLFFACKNDEIYDTNFDDVMQQYEADSESINFAVHYIDVGQADAALVICDGKAMLIDGGNKDDSQLIYTYLKNTGTDYLEYVVATHVHEDHIGGIPGALNYADFGTAYCNTAEHENELFRDFEKYVKGAGKSIKVPFEGETFELGSALVEIVSCGRWENENDASIVLKVTYGNTSFLFTGDIENEAEYSILNKAIGIESTVLKVAHHGSDDSTSYPFLLAVDPDYAVISVGENNDYGHPSEKVLKRLKNADVEYYRTDIHGNIICTSDGESVSFSFYRNSENIDLDIEKDGISFSENVLFVEGKEVTYVGNKNSKKFHYPHCDSVEDMNEKNRQYFFGARYEAIEFGFSPCGACKP